MKLARAFILTLFFATISARKIYAAGSGHDMLSQLETAEEIIALSGKDHPSVLYLGTATYDSQDAFKAQTFQFAALGCKVDSLKVAYLSPSHTDLVKAFSKIDIIVVSGGNTLFAVDRFKKLGIDKLIVEAENRNVVLAGGSAGGIVWFDGGHSDSMDATTYKNPPGPLLNPSLSPEQLKKIWSYIRVDGLGVLPGLFCPHYDVTEGNGVLRATSFEVTMKNNAGEYAVAVDNWAALVIEDDHYRFVSRKGHTGSVGPTGHFTSNFTIGHPGAWKLEINATNGAMLRTLVPTEGKTVDLFRPARYIVESAQLTVARLQNPDDGKPPSETLM